VILVRTSAASNLAIIGGSSASLDTAPCRRPSCAD